MQKLVIFTVSALLVAGCVSKKEIRAVEATDNAMSCEALAQEVSRLELLRDEMSDDSGFTGKNVGMALLFWPGIFVNESRANANVESVDDRINHLNRIRMNKCGEAPATTVATSGDAAPQAEGEQAATAAETAPVTAELDATAGGEPTGADVESTAP